MKHKTIRKNLIITWLIIFASFFSGCTEEIHIDKYIDTNIPLTIRINKKDNSNVLLTTNNSEIAINSEKYKKIIEWSNENNFGWESTPASYNSNIYIGQNNFRMLILSDNVVIGFIDKNGNSKQFIKPIKNGDFDFLIK